MPPNWTIQGGAPLPSAQAEIAQANAADIYGNSPFAPLFGWQPPQQVDTTGLQYGGQLGGADAWNQQYQNQIATGNARQAPTTDYGGFTAQNQAAAQGALSRQSALGSSLEGIASGAMPTLATQQYQQGLQQNLMGNQALANSARGGTASFEGAQRMGQEQRANMLAQSAAPEAMLQAQGQQQAQQQLGSIYGTYGNQALGAAQQGIGQAQFGAQMGMSQEQLNQANQLAQLGFQQNVNAQQLGVNSTAGQQAMQQQAALQRQLQGQQNALAGGLITGGATALGAAFGGPAGAAAGGALGSAVSSAALNSNSAQPPQTGALPEPGQASSSPSNPNPNDPTSDERVKYAIR